MMSGMIVDKSYQAVTGRKGDIIQQAMGVDYSRYESGSIAFDYEGMMNDTGYTLEDHIRLQRRFNVGNTPIFELHNLTALARKYAAPGKGARIFVKDEASNPAGSFKERRAVASVYHAKKLGYKGVIAATSGNYGAAVASQAAMQGLKCIIVQECYDSHFSGQPEIIEKARKCEALGAEVLQLSVGPELFYEVLMMLEETGYFNASLYSAFGVGGVETLGWELAHQFMERCGRHPDVVVCANAGGGNLTGTARGLQKAGCSAQVVAEMAWCFLDAMRFRCDDHPLSATGMDFKQYIVPFEDSEQDLVFYKCRQTDRWWMELPCSDEQRQRYGRHCYLACAYHDYETATEGNVPHRWWNAVQRIK